MPRIGHRMKTFLKKTQGFTLVEMILYVGIFAVVLSLIVQLFWQVQITESRTRLNREVKVNMAQAMELMKDTVRNSNTVDEGASTFLSHPGTLTVDNALDTEFDTYTKNVTLGDEEISIRKLRMTEGFNSYDVTSDHVDVTNFVITNKTAASGPDSVQIELTIEAVSTNTDEDFNASLSSKSTYNVRQEN